MDKDLNARTRELAEHLEIVQPATDPVASAFTALIAATEERLSAIEKRLNAEELRSGEVDNRLQKLEDKNDPYHPYND